jgi:hypothetical protein
VRIYVVAERSVGQVASRSFAFDLVVTACMQLFIGFVIVVLVIVLRFAYGHMVSAAARVASLNACHSSKHAYWFLVFFL